MKLVITFLILSLFTVSKAQDVNIVPYLIQIERGAIDSVITELEKLKIKYSQNPDVKFLEAITIPDAQKAEEMFLEIVEKYPTSKYADASAYRLFNYYLIQNEIQLVEKFYAKLKNEYSESPYFKFAQNQYELLSSSKEIEKEKQIPKTEIKKSVNYTYTIQAGAFVKKENAQSLKSQFEKSGIYSEIKEKNVAGTIFSVVFAGKFENREDAESFLVIINSQFNIQGRVVEIGK